MIASPAWVVDEARSWIRTPYHKGARLKGLGVDCGTILLDVFQKGGFLSEEDAKKLDELIPVNQDWFLHAKEEKYLRLVIRHARHVLTAISYPTLEAKPGCIVLTRHEESAKRWNHAGIVTEWPRLIHAVAPVVAEVDATKDRMWCYREVSVFDPWLKAEAQ